MYLIDTKHKISSRVHNVRVRVAINNIGRVGAPSAPVTGAGHLLWETPTCWQWSVTREPGCTIWTWSRIVEREQASSVTGEMVEEALITRSSFITVKVLRIELKNKYIVRVVFWLPRLFRMSPVLILSMSVARAVTVVTTVTNKVRGCRVSHIVNINITHNSRDHNKWVRTLPVCEQNPPPIMIMANFFSSSHEPLVTDIEHGLNCATEIETYCALYLLRMRMFTDT